MQEVTGLLQHELQKSPVLLDTVYCQHTHILLQHAASLDVLLRMVPLFEATQQAAVYQALCSSLPRVDMEGKWVVCASWLALRTKKGSCGSHVGGGRKQHAIIRSPCACFM